MFAAVFALVLVSGAPAASPPVQEVAAGYYHTCALLSGNVVKCWGSNGYGQLADATTKDRHSATRASGISGTIESLSAGANHTCALIVGGTVECWGWNDYGQLGNGTTAESQPPQHVSGLSGVVSVEAGGLHTCALLSGGAVKCWGDNRNGQLGNGSKTNSAVPVEVVGLSSGVQAIAVGALHTCALVGGAAKCWGNNAFGQLGDETTTDRTAPVPAKLTAGVRALAAGGGHTCALLDGGAMRCWGDDEYGQLGNDQETPSHPSPVAVQNLPANVQSIVAGFVDTCALTASDEVSCWGNLFEDAPEDVRTLSNGVTAITLAGGDTYEDHACAIMAAGGIKCWGANDEGQLGNGLSDSSLRFTPPVLGLADGIQVLTIIVDGHGTVTGSGITCHGKCAYERDQGASVVPTAKASKGWAFRSWGGACKGKKRRCTLALNATGTATAHFRKR
jgi:alpha-tubulin suppressor-like RCC1 family protein